MKNKQKIKRIYQPQARVTAATEPCVGRWRRTELKLTLARSEREAAPVPGS